MTDSVQAMKDWRRMCKFCSDEGMADGRHGCADVCPIGDNPVCGDLQGATDRDIEDAAKAIEKWAEEHPEPRYPTWGEWLQSMGVAVLGSGMLSIHPAIAEQPIPAEMAEKLEIEPKA